VASQNSNFIINCHDALTKKILIKNGGISWSILFGINNARIDSRIKHFPVLIIGDLWWGGRGGVGVAAVCTAWCWTGTHAG